MESLSAHQTADTVVTIPGPPGRFDHVVFSGSVRPRPPRRRQPAATAPRPVYSASIAEPGDHDFLHRACRISGLDPTLYRESIYRRRAGAGLRALKASSRADATERIEHDPAAAGRALGALLIGVTSFMRDAPVFEALRGALPRLVAGRDEIRALSVGCSDGSELYSVAILLDGLGVLDRSRLTGIDCRPAAIAAAALGTYPAAAVESLDADVRDRCFDRVPGGGRAVAPRLRAACRWEVGDAFAHPLVADCDVVLCRNLSIYLNPEPAQRLWRRLHAALRPGGLLVVGKAERPAGLQGLVRAGPCLFRKEAAP